MAQFMNMYTVELNDGAAPVVSLKQIHQGNHKANRVGARVVLNGAPFALGGNCGGTAILADGSTVPLTGVVSGNECYVELDNACYQVEGKISVFVTWVSGNLETTLLAAVGTVRNTETGNVIQPSTPVPDLAQLMAQITAMQEATAAANAAATKAVRYDTDQSASITAAQKATARHNILAAGQNDLAPLFSEAANYTAGKYVYYNDALYCFTADHSAGAWVGTDAVNVALGGDVAALRSAFDSEVFFFSSDASLWESGTINGNTGHGADNPTRIRTIRQLDQSIVSIMPTNGYMIAIYAYNGDTYVGTWNGATFEQTTSRVAWVGSEFYLGAYDYNFRISVHNADSTEISVSDASNILLGKSKIAENAAEIIKKIGMNFGSSTILENGTNVDRLIDYGCYRVTTQGNAATMTGTPPFVSVGYRLFVVETTQQNRAYQFALGNGNTLIRYRKYMGTSWTDWAEICSVDNAQALIDEAVNEVDGEIASIVNKKIGMNYDSSTLLENGTNIDELFGYGCYRVYSSTGAETMTGTPPFRSVGYRLFVVETTRENRAYQFALGDSLTRIRYRKYTGTSWTDWAEICSVDNAQSLIDSAVASVDERVESIDNQLFKETANVDLWESGSRNGNTGNRAVSSTRIRTKNKLSADYLAISPNDGYAYAVYAYDLDGYVGVWTGTAFEKTTHGVTWFTEEKYFSSFGDYQYTISVKRTDEGEISTAEASNILFKKRTFATTEDIEFPSNPVKIRIMQYNIGNFNMGGKLAQAYRYLNTDILEPVVNNYKRVFGDCQPDIIGFEEFEDEMVIPGASGSEDETVSFNEILFDRLYPNGYDDTHLDIESYKAVKTKYNLLDVKRLTQTPSYVYDGATYTTTTHPLYGHIEIMGKTIGFVVNAFPNSQDTYSPERNLLMKKATYQAAVDVLENDEYAFIICDANALADVAESILNDVLAPAGYDSAHGSYFPWQPTYQSRSDSTIQRPLDNIYYKKAKIQLVNFKVLWDERPNLASDHVPVYADFIIS